MWTNETKAAFIIARAAELSAEIAGMQAENQYRLECGLQVAYGKDAFDNLIPCCYPELGHNNLIEFFRGD